jgi:hypothetical protein
MHSLGGERRLQGRLGAADDRDPFRYNGSTWKKLSVAVTSKDPLHSPDAAAALQAPRARIPAATSAHSMQRVGSRATLLVLEPWSSTDTEWAAPTTSDPSTLPTTSEPATRTFTPEHDSGGRACATDSTGGRGLCEHGGDERCEAVGVVRDLEVVVDARDCERRTEEAVIVHKEMWGSDHAATSSFLPVVVNGLVDVSTLRFEFDRLTDGRELDRIGDIAPFFEQCGAQG